jgi:hypothetical protein
MSYSNKLIDSFLEKSFLEFKSNSIYKPQDFKELLIIAAQGHDFIETISSIFNGVNADTLFRRIEQFSYTDMQQEAFNLTLHKTCKGRKSLVKLAIDTTYENYYGKKQGFWIHPYNPDKGTTGSFKFAEVSVVQDKRYVLHAFPLHIGYNKARAIAGLLSKAEQFVRIRLLLLDREFYSAEVINLLNSLRKKYIILVSKNKLVKKLLSQMKAGESKVVKHTLTLNINKSKYKIKTKLVLIKALRNKEGKRFDWCFATNLNYKPETIKLLYTNRWGIETSNRCVDDIAIKTKSTHIAVRTFLFLFSCLLYNLWIWLKQEGFNLTLRQVAYALFFTLVLRIDSTQLTNPV